MSLEIFLTRVEFYFQVVNRGFQFRRSSFGEFHRGNLKPIFDNRHFEVGSFSKILINFVQSHLSTILRVVMPNLALVEV